MPKNIVKTNLSIQYVEIEKLKRYEQNAKIHTEKQIKKIVSSMKQFGVEYL